MNRGKIIQVAGPVVDCVFPDGQLPKLREALVVNVDGENRYMEVSQMLGNSEVRCIILERSEGLARDMEVKATGSGIRVPVGDVTIPIFLGSKGIFLLCSLLKRPSSSSFFFSFS